MRLLQTVACKGKHVRYGTTLSWRELEARGHGRTCPEGERLRKRVFWLANWYRLTDWLRGEAY